MATSGQSTFNPAAYDIIAAALRLCGVIDPEEDPSGADRDTALEALNLLLKQFQTTGPNLWRQVDGVLFLNRGQYRYLLGPDGAEACREDDLVETTLLSAASLGATSISVSNSVGIEVGDRIGIELINGARQWTTVSVVGGSVTIADALTAAAAARATVVAYTNKLDRPVRVTDAYRRAYGIDVPIDIVARQEYDSQPNKSSQGKTVLAYYSPQLGNGVFSIWPAADSVKDQIRFTYERPIEVIADNDNTFDLPEEQIEGIKFRLAERIAPEYSLPLERIAYLKGMADQLIGDGLSFDQDVGSLFLQPGR